MPGFLQPAARTAVSTMMTSLILMVPVMLPRCRRRHGENHRLASSCWHIANAAIRCHLAIHKLDLVGRAGQSDGSWSFGEVVVQPLASAIVGYARWLAHDLQNLLFSHADGYGVDLIRAGHAASRQHHSHADDDEFGFHIGG